MKATRTVTWTTKTGKNIEVRIERTKEVQSKTAYADGWNVDLGKETVDSIHFEVVADDKFVTRDYHKPEIISEMFYKTNYKELKANGVYARLGDAYINEEQYIMIMAAISEMEAELTTSQEFEAVKAQEEAKEAERFAVDKAEAEQFAAQIRNGLCPRCGTYCYGDCEAN